MAFLFFFKLLVTSGRHGIIAGEFPTFENIYNGAISQNPAHLNSVSINIIKNCNVLDYSGTCFESSHIAGQSGNLLIF